MQGFTSLWLSQPSTCEGMSSLNSHHLIPSFLLDQGRKFQILMFHKKKTHTIHCFEDLGPRPSPPKSHLTKKITPQMRQETKILVVPSACLAPTPHTWLPLNSKTCNPIIRPAIITCGGFDWEESENYRIMPIPG